LAIIVFGVIIFVHELGHFLAARACGIVVEEFALGLGPKIIKFKRGYTLYSLRLFPIGGFCRMMDSEPEEGEDNQTTDNTDKIRIVGGSFNSKPVWKRMLVLAAGSVMNALLALILMFVLFSADYFVDTAIAGFRPGFNYAQAGLEAGDRVTHVDGSRILVPSDIFDRTSAALRQNPGEPLDLRVIREGRRVDVVMFHGNGVAILGIADGSPAEYAGLLGGDRITAVNGHAVNNTTETQAALAAALTVNPQLAISLEIQRNGEVIILSVTPEFNQEIERYMIGISYDERDFVLGVKRGMFVRNVRHEGVPRAGFGDALRMGTNYSVFLVRTTFQSLGMLIRREANVGDLMGPIGMVALIGDAYEAGMDTAGVSAAIINIVWLCALLSVNLAVLNLLPLPMLDGGKLVFLTIEGIRRKPLPPEKEGIVHLIGFGALMLLTIFIAYNDILRIFQR